MIPFQNNKTIIQEAFALLYPDKAFPYDADINYTARFKDYNANVKLRGNNIEFGLCKKWRAISKEIRIGLIQDLFLKIRKDKSHEGSMYIDLYHNFVKSLYLAVPKDRIDSHLEQAFDRVNERYFLGIVEKPNLVWGQDAKRKLGSYDFKNDTITMSSIFKTISRQSPELMDYVMYHEMLHKQHKYKAGRHRTCYHDKKFRQAEAAFENHTEIEKKLNHAVRYAKRERIGGIASFFLR